MKYSFTYYFKVTASVIFILTGITVILPFFIPHHYILSSLPECEHKTKYNQECAACGLTRSFCEISKGNVNAAAKLNSASIPLFGVFLMYQIIFSVYLFQHKYKKYINKHIT